MKGQVKGQVKSTGKMPLEFGLELCKRMHIQTCSSGGQGDAGNTCSGTEERYSEKCLILIYESFSSFYFSQGGRGQSIRIYHCCVYCILPIKNRSDISLAFDPLALSMAVLPSMAVLYQSDACASPAH